MKILLALNGSKHPEGAVDTLIKQHRPEATEVVLVHAIDSASLTDMPGSRIRPACVQDCTSLLRRSWAAAEDLVSETAARLQKAGFSVRTHVEEGDSRQLLLDFAKEWHPDVIVVSSHDQEGSISLFPGNASLVIAR